MKTRIYEGIRHGDWVRCTQCGAQMLLPCGADQCPECYGYDTLVWVDEDKARMKGMNQGVWLSVQELAHDGRWTQAAEELVSSCGLTEDECRELQEESGSFNDEMLDFINSVFGHEDMINNSITLENIGYHKIGSIFKYNIGSKEVELEVVESSDASCEGCVFNNSKNYYCKDTHCIDVDRKDDIDVIYKEIKRS